MTAQDIWSRELDTSDSFLLITTCCQLVERIIRFEEYLKKATYAVELSEPVPNVIKYLQSLVLNEKRKLSNFIKHYSEEQEIYDNKKEKREGLYGDLLRISNNINKYHQKGLQWVFCPWPDKVVNDFLIQISSEAELEPFFENLHGTNVLSNRYNFWECPIHRQLKPQKDKENSTEKERSYYVFGLPKIELGNCLLWQTVLHEVAHGIIDKNSILDGFLTQREIEKHREKKSTLENWIREFGADLMAAKMIGPSYLITLTIYFVTSVYQYDFWNATISHPPIRLRIDSLFKELQGQLGDLHVDLKRYLDLVDRLCGQRLKYEIETSDEEKRVIRAEFKEKYFPVDFLKGIIKRLSEKLDDSFSFRKFNDQDLKKSHELSERLSKWILISSSPVDMTVLHNLRNAKKSRKVSLVIEDPSKFNECPNRIADIVTAGTLCKLDTQRDWFYKSFLDNERDENSGGFENFRNQLLKFDELVEKSIETAIIHSYFAAKS